MAAMDAIDCDRCGTPLDETLPSAVRSGVGQTICLRCATTGTRLRSAVR